MSAPKLYHITSADQLLAFNFENEQFPFICKRIDYDKFDRSKLILLPRPARAETVSYINLLLVDNEHPYGFQEFIQGQEYCTHRTCIDSELTLYTCSRSSAWKMNYKQVEHLAIFERCMTFIRSLKLTGHVSFDFIVTNNDGRQYAIECNPRVH